MVEGLLGGIGAILTGGATGLLGTIATGLMSHFERAQRHHQEVELRRLDLEITRGEQAAAERIAAIDAESRESEAAWSAFEASHHGAAVRWSQGDSAWLVAVDVVRGLIRPILTVGFLALAAVIYFHLPMIPPADVGVRLIDTILYLATTTTLWWFGTRPKGASRH